jgi:hypothetical protein
MNHPHSNASLVAALRSRFPAEAALTDHWLRERGWDPTDDNTAIIWVEAFADRTTEAVARRDEETVRAHTNFIAAAYRAAPDALRTIVDVSYAENLMWDSSAADKKWAWSFIAAEIRQLFTDMWGDPTSGKG